MTNPAIAALLTLPPAHSESDLLLALLGFGIDVSDETAMAAINADYELTLRSEEAIDRCLNIHPTPAPRPPLGF